MRHPEKALRVDRVRSRIVAHDEYDPVRGRLIHRVLFLLDLQAQVRMRHPQNINVKLGVDQVFRVLPVVAFGGQHLRMVLRSLVIKRQKIMPRRGVCHDGEPFAKRLHLRVTQNIRRMSHVIQCQKAVTRRLGVSQALDFRPRQARMLALSEKPVLAGHQQDAAPPLRFQHHSLLLGLCRQ